MRNTAVLFLLSAIAWPTSASAEPRLLQFGPPSSEVAFGAYKLGLLPLDGRFQHFSGRLAYTYRSHFFVGLDRSAAENQDSYGQLDASLNWKVNDNISLTLDGLNLTDGLLKYYALSKTQPRAVYDNGRQVFFGIRLKY